MATDILGMYGNISGGTQDALASIDIPQDGVITGVDLDLNANLDADDEDVAGEVSFIATNQLSQNDVRGRITSVSAHVAVLTSGIPVVSTQKFVGPMDLPVAGGERLYLHVVSTASVNGTFRANVHLDVSSRAGSRRSARRR